MKQLVRLSLAALLVGAALAPSAEGITYSDRASWEGAVGAWTDVDETQIPTVGTPFTAGSPILLPSGTTLTFGSELYGYQVGPNPGEWATWSGGNTPRVLAAFGAFDGVTPTSVDATASAAIWAFGLEMEPNQLAQFNMTLSTGEILTQFVNGDSGAAFFGWSDLPVVSFTMSTDDSYGFAFGRMVEGPGAPVPTPDAGSLTLATGLLWAGMITIRRRSRRDEQASKA